ncbi:hypothetical protein BS47DRAFT_1367683 [Hydnum rufescens UP504]|uniref:Uncharacterized protein n=1 Tax=Hydnum rufescens UP504 TaxID=1448309 RepID=A0A9P6DP81_9AGAM|nr:hypothetical protein BS47DRAFT_1367683 [Hydnum rufescens UP504]
MRIGNLAISTREWRSAGNPWNAYQASYEKDPEPDCPHHEYVEKVIQPAYRELIAAHSGEDSDAWKKTLKELSLSRLSKRWKDDLEWMATMNIHRFCGIVSGIPDEVASKQNALFTSLPICLSQKTGQHLLCQNQKQKIPKSMHLMWKEISEELNNLLTPLIGRVPCIPWASLPRFLANNELKIENWVVESEFPSLLSLDVSVVRMESWKKLWRTFFQPSDDSTKWMDRGSQMNLMPTVPMGLPIAGGASGPRKRASQGGASSVGGQSSGTTWGGTGSSVDGVVNGQFSGNAPSGAINGPMDWAGGYGQNQQEYNPHDDPLMASLFVRYPDLNLGLNQGFDDGFPL